MVKTTPGKGSKGKGSATASPSKPSPQKATVSVRDQRFHETSIHKRLKTLLNEHRSCRRSWNSHIVAGLPAASKIVSIRSETLSALQNKPPAAKNAKGEDDKLLNDLYRARQAGLLEERCFALANIVLSLKEQCDRMKAIETKTYSLLLEASRSFGFEFAFSEPMYFTWTLERFSETLSVITANYLSSFHLIQSLFTTLTDHTSSIQESQAALSYWACQPHLASEGPYSSRGFEEVLDFELG